LSKKEISENEPLAVKSLRLWPKTPPLPYVSVEQRIVRNVWEERFDERSLRQGFSRPPFCSSSKALNTPKKRAFLFPVEKNSNIMARLDTMLPIDHARDLSEQNGF